MRGPRWVNRRCMTAFETNNQTVKCRGIEHVHLECFAVHSSEWRGQHTSGILNLAGGVVLNGWLTWWVMGERFVTPICLHYKWQASGPGSASCHGLRDLEQPGCGPLAGLRAEGMRKWGLYLCRSEVRCWAWRRERWKVLGIWRVQTARCVNEDERWCLTGGQTEGPIDVWIKEQGGRKKKQKLKKQKIFNKMMCTLLEESTIVIQ